ncbi:hypothetical protein MZP69_000716 [Klebsiella oxytoca]|nr:hypothetical protein [Klebsiella oxytoca]
MKIKKEFMINVIGCLLTCCGILLVIKVFSLTDITNTYVSSFLGVFFGMVGRALFKKSVTRIQNLEVVKLKTLHDKHFQLLKRIEDLEANNILPKSRFSKEWNQKFDKLINVESELEVPVKDKCYTYDKEKYRFIEKHYKHDFYVYDRSEGKYVNIIKQKDFLNNEIAKNKNQTVVNLFLLKEKKTLLFAKFIAVILFILAVFSMMWLDTSLVFMLPGGVLYCLLELKERVLTYRVNMGYFGTNATEALILLKFIHDNIDDINNGSDGGKRKILNDEIKPEADAIALPEGAHHG